MTILQAKGSDDRLRCFLDWASSGDFTEDVAGDVILLLASDNEMWSEIRGVQLKRIWERLCRRKREGEMLCRVLSYAANQSPSSPEARVVWRVASELVIFPPASIPKAMPDARIAPNPPNL